MTQADTIQYISPYLLPPTDTATATETDTADYLLMCNDSIFAPYKDIQTRHRKSMFSANELSSQEAMPTMRYTEPSTDWIFATVIVLAGVMSLYFNIQKFKIKDILRSLFDIRTLERVFRESNVRTVSLMPMAAIYIACLALCVNKASNLFGTMLFDNSPLATLIIFFAIALFILMKNEIIRLLGTLFEMRNCIKLYLCSNYLFYFLGALTILPLTLFLFYSTFAEKTMVYIISIYVAILFVVRILRGMQLILTNHESSKLHLFYYLCCLEIVPILVIIKIVII